MRRISFFLACAMTLALSPLALPAQEVFNSPHADYTLELPNATWKVTTRPDAAHEHAEFVYGDRIDGHLRIRKEVVSAGQEARDLARRDQDMKFRYQPGYVGGKEESFAGRLNGSTTSYEYTSGGKAMVGRVYYLQADNRTVYTLHFTGMRDKLLLIRNQTDSIARSFRLK
jgi:hypothetical protein